MANEPSLNDMRNLWQNQEVERVSMSLEQICRRAQAFEGRIRRRNAVEYIACAFVVVVFSYTMWTVPHALMRVGEALCIAGMLYLAYQLHRRASAEAVPADVSCVEFYRRELFRQMVFHRNIWRWYLGPLIPGLAVIALSAALESSHRWPYARLFVAIYVLLCTGMFALVALWNRRVAEQLQGRIEELDANDKES